MTATLRSSLYSEFLAPSDLNLVNDYFKKVCAQDWRLKGYLNYRLETEDIIPTWTVVFNDWKKSLEKIISTNHTKIPYSVKNFCKELISFKTFEGGTILEQCMGWYNNFYERYCDLQLTERAQHIEEKIYSSQKVSEVLQETTNKKNKKNKKRPQDDDEAGPSDGKRICYEHEHQDESQISEEDEGEGEIYTSSVEWEFDYPIHDWLDKIIKEQEIMMSNMNSNIVLKPLLWRIIDLSYPEVAPSTLTSDDQEEIRKLISSALRMGQTNEWTVLVPSAERCLWSLARLTIKQMKKIAKTVKPYGIHGAVQKVRKYLTSSNEEEINDNLIREEDYKDNDVSYIFELLRYTFEMISLGIPLRQNSERDINIFIKSTIFTCFNGVVDRHFGEAVSLASRERRKNAIDASPDVEGYHIDWPFTCHDLAKDMAWGQEFSLCERAGSKIENNKKILDNTIKVQKTLKDMHKTLIDTITLTSGGAISKEIFDIISKLLIPGFISSRFFIRLILIMYVGAGFYLSAELAEFDIPTTYEEISSVLKIARIMLQAKKILSSTVTLYASTKERAEKERFLSGKMLLPDQPKGFYSPMK